MYLSGFRKILIFVLVYFSASFGFAEDIYESLTQAPIEAVEETPEIPITNSHSDLDISQDRASINYPYGRAPWIGPYPEDQVHVSTHPLNKKKSWTMGSLKDALNFLVLTENMPDLPFRIIKPQEKAYYGSIEMYDFLYTLGRKVQEFLPNYKLRIGDISQEQGGRLCFIEGRKWKCHQSHQYGVDVDVGYIFDDPDLEFAKDFPDWDTRLSSRQIQNSQVYLQKKGRSLKINRRNLRRGFRNTPSRRLTSISQDNINRAPNALRSLRKDIQGDIMWEMLKTAVSSKQLILSVVSPSIKAYFCKQAWLKGDIDHPRDDSTLGGEVLRRMFTEKKYHGDHFHFRIRCSSSQPNCIQKDEFPATGDNGCPYQQSLN